MSCIMRNRNLQPVSDQRFCVVTLAFSVILKRVRNIVLFKHLK